MRTLTHHRPKHDDENDDEGWIALKIAARRMRVCRDTMRDYLIRGTFTSRRNPRRRNRWEVRADEIDAARRELDSDLPDSDEGWIALNDAAQRMRVCRETMRMYLVRGSFTSRRNPRRQNRWEVRADEIETALRGRPDLGYAYLLELVPDAMLEAQEQSV